MSVKDLNTFQLAVIIGAQRQKAGGFMEQKKQYIAIDLKSFYASVECVDRQLDPLTVNLVVADPDRTQKTICLAVSPSLKGYGIPGRPRLFEVVQKVKQINAERRSKAPGGRFAGSSWNSRQLAVSPELALSYIVAPPRMARYMEYSRRIYRIYLNYIAPEDIHVYSIDEVFIDATPYLRTMGITAHELARRMIREVLNETGITATAGIGTNLYLCKVAMDIVAKHVPADVDGVRIAELDEMSYRKLLWNHRPLTDFWRVGKGYARKLEAHGLMTMGDIARCSVGRQGTYFNQELLFRLFGVNAELLIDHAWGWEPCGMKEIRQYRPSSTSLGKGQVLQEAYSWQKARLVCREMGELLILEMVDKNVVSDQIVLSVGYDIENCTDPERRKAYHGEIVTDGYGRKVPKSAHGSARLPYPTNSAKIILEELMKLMDRITDPTLLVRRVNITMTHIQEASEVRCDYLYEQMDLFSEPKPVMKIDKEALKKENNVQKAIISIQKKFGKNAVLKGMNLEEGATTIQRNQQIGGHKA